MQRRTHVPTSGTHKEREYSNPNVFPFFATQYKVRQVLRCNKFSPICSIFCVGRLVLFWQSRVDYFEGATGSLWCYREAPTFDALLSTSDQNVRKGVNLSLEFLEIKVKLHAHVHAQLSIVFSL